MASFAVITADPMKSPERVQDEKLAPRAGIARAPLCDENVGVFAALKRMLPFEFKVGRTDASVLVRGDGDFPTFGENSPSSLRISNLFSSGHVGHRFAFDSTCSGSCGAQTEKSSSRLSVE
jgi:hypothetical protein